MPSSRIASGTASSSATTPKPDVLDYPREPYDLKNDWTQAKHVAAKYPETPKELQALFMEEARKQVLPLDNSVQTRIIAARPRLTVGRNLSAGKIRL